MWNGRVASTKRYKGRTHYRRGAERKDVNAWGGQGSNKSLSTLAFTLAKLLLPPFLPSFRASAVHPLLVCDHDIITYMAAFEGQRKRAQLNGRVQPTTGRAQCSPNQIVSGPIPLTHNLSAGTHRRFGVAASRTHVICRVNSGVPVSALLTNSPALISCDEPTTLNTTALLAIS